ncbi:MAG: sigma-70 family RNA polymerase sigma factor [Alphaproteobacteria bacterium]|nr:sigma-70 family RNA polymerase sigma factor [Alphaproteobacteria bacterium]
MAQHEDGELLERIGAGDSAAFRQLAERHTLRLLRTARSILRDETEAEDIVQEAMLRLWRRASELTVENQADGIGAWLNRTTRNLAIDRYRRAKRVDLVDEFPETAASEESPHAQLENQERSQDVENAIDRLPERQRTAILLFHHQGLSVAEISSVLETSEHATESLLARARRTLKDSLQSVWRTLNDTD